MVLNSKPRWDNMFRHINNEHANQFEDEKKECVDCKKSFTSKFAMLNHSCKRYNLRCMSKIVAFFVDGSAKRGMGIDIKCEFFNF